MWKESQGEIPNDAKPEIDNSIFNKYIIMDWWNRDWLPLSVGTILSGSIGYPLHSHIHFSNFS